MNDDVDALHRQIDDLQSKLGAAAQEVVHLRATLGRAKAALVTEEDVTLRLQSRLDGCLKRLDPVRESDSCVVDNIDRLNFEVSELKRTNQILAGRLDTLSTALEAIRGLANDFWGTSGETAALAQIKNIVGPELARVVETCAHEWVEVIAFGGASYCRKCDAIKPGAVEKLNTIGGPK